LLLLLLLGQLQHELLLLLLLMLMLLPLVGGGFTVSLCGHRPAAHRTLTGLLNATCTTCSTPTTHSTLALPLRLAFAVHVLNVGKLHELL
jgi:hypothetical protein